ncbi:unnamed protein product, partial [marine sediment metagenome]
MGYPFERQPADMGTAGPKGIHKSRFDNPMFDTCKGIDFSIVIERVYPPATTDKKRISLCFS